jgi:hypothetical protein
MDFCLFFIATIVAYRMGARGVWLFAIFMFSWVAFVIWLVVRDDKRQSRDREQKREDAELERTLLLVRAMNPALAEEIAEQKAYERVAPLMASRPPRPARKPLPRHQTIVVIFAFLLVLTALAMAPQAQPPASGQTKERDAAINHGEARGSCAGLHAAAEMYGLPHGSLYEDYVNGRALGVCK